MITLSNNQMLAAESGMSWSDLSYGCKLSLIGLGLTYASLFCVTGVVGAAVAVSCLNLAPFSIALSCS